MEFTLNKSYVLRDGSIVLLDSVSSYVTNWQNISIYTSNQLDGSWNKHGSFLPNLLFGEKFEHSLDIVGENNE